MIKLIATDLDGTILNDDGGLNKEFESVFNELEKRNIIFMAASGRQYPNLKKVFECAKDRMMFVAENGTFAVHKGKELFCNSMKKENVEEIIEYTRTIKSKEAVLNTKYCAYIECKDPEFKEMLGTYCASIKVVDDLKDVKEEILKVAIHEEKAISENCQDYFDKFSDRLQVCTSGDHWMDISEKGVNKGTALEHIKKEYNIDYNEVMIFGDQMNDFEMMETGYYSYAMENAIDGLKERARFMAGSNNNNGVLEKIKEVIGIQL